MLHRMSPVRAAGAALCLILLQSCAHNRDQARRDYFLRGETFFAAGSYPDAEIQFRKALQEDPRFGDAWLHLARSEERLGRYAPALDAFTRAIDLMPWQDAPKIAMANLLLVAYLGNAAHPPALYQQISMLSRELLAHDPASADGFRFKGYLALSDKDPAAAVDYFEQAARLKPDQPDITTGLCESLMQSGKQERAERVALDFIQKMPSYGPLYTILYHSYSTAGRMADAEAILRRKVSANPKESRYRIELARHYADTGKALESSDALSHILNDPKSFPHGPLEVGDFYRDAHDWTRAGDQYLKGAQIDASLRITYWKRLVQVDLAQNDRPAARRILDQILKEQPDDPETLASSAALRESLSDPEQQKEALSEFAALVARAPDNAEYRFQYAEALRRAGRIDDAHAQFLVVSQHQPSSLAAVQALADISIHAGHFDEALTYADRALALSPADPRAILVRSAALAAKGRLPETHALLTDLAARHPELREAQLQLALLDIERRHYPDAEARLRKLYTPGTGDIRSLKGLIEVYRAQNQMDRALALLKQDLDKAPQSNEVRALLAKTAAEAGDNNLAIAQYQQLARVQPQSPQIALALGLARQAAGDHSGAIAEFERARMLTPGDPRPNAFLGRALDEQGRQTEAAASYRKSLSLDNHNPWVMNNLAYLLADTGGDLNEAMALARNASHADPGNPSFSDTVGWIYLKQKNVPSALHVFQGLADKTPGNFTLRLHLSQALLASGDRNHAVTELQTALSLSSTATERSTAEKLLKQTKNDPLYR